MQISVNWLVKDIENGSIDPEGRILAQAVKIKTQLKPHELRIVAEMTKREKVNKRITNGMNMGIICDKVGAGKSLSVLAEIANHKCINIDEYESNRGFEDADLLRFPRLEGFVFNSDREIKTNLIIVPHNTLLEWVRYTTTMTSLKFLEVSEAKHINHLKEELKEETNFEASDGINSLLASSRCNEDSLLEYLEQFDFVLVSSSKYVAFINVLYQNEQPREKIANNLWINSKHNQHISYLFENEPQKLKYEFCFKHSCNMLEALDRLNSIYRIIKDVDLLTYKNDCEILLDLREQLLTNSLTGVMHTAENFKYEASELSSNVENTAKVIESLTELFDMEKLDNQISEIDLIDSIYMFEEHLEKAEPYLLNLKNFAKQGECFVNEVVCWNNPIFERVIIDEINSIKLPGQVPVYGIFNWYITSSIESLIGTNLKFESTGFLQRYFTTDSVEASFNLFYKKIFLKNLDVFVSQSFNLPNYETQVLKCSMPRSLEILEGFAFPSIIQSLNAGDVGTAIEILGCETVNMNNVVGEFLDKLNKDKKTLVEKVELKEKQIQLIEETNETEPEEHEKTYYYKKKIEKYERKIEEVDRSLNGIEERIENLEDEDCPICYENKVTHCIFPCCKNTVCIRCVSYQTEYSNDKTKVTCPMCRTVVTVQTLVAVSEYVAESDPNSKMETLIRLLESDGKFLIFSEYDNTFTEIETRLNQEGINHSRLCGTSSHLNKVINNFESGELKVLMLNAKHSGTGLNLEMATDVILYHKMNPDLEMEVIGRGERPGRTSPLQVTYLRHENELE